MTIARSEIVDPASEGVFHCMTRCVRRAFLCGTDDLSGMDFGHRKKWVRDRLRLLSTAFSIDILSYAVMSNHLHLVVRTLPVEAAGWNAMSVARRWLLIYPQRLANGKLPARPTAAQIKALASDAERIAVLRVRLTNLSWMMKALNEHIARRANREDDCTGRFWEGRFKCQRLLDEQAILTCMAYVDLNAVRSGAAKSLSDPQVTSAHDRIEAYQGRKRAAGLRERARSRVRCGRRRHRVKAVRAANRESHMSRAEKKKCDEALRQSRQADFLAKIGVAGSPLGISEESYLELLDWTGRQVRSDKRGAIPETLSPLLTELDINTELWLESIDRFDGWFARIAGKAKHMAKEAARLGRRWLRGIGPSRRLFGPAEPA